MGEWREVWEGGGAVPFSLPLLSIGGSVTHGPGFARVKRVWSAVLGFVRREGIWKSRTWEGGWMWSTRKKDLK